MKPATQRHVVGSLRILRERSVAVDRPGLAVWAEAGEKAAVAVGATVRDAAHRAEINALEIARTVQEVVADGKVTPAELRKLKRLQPQATDVAGDCHDITEIVQP